MRDKENSNASTRVTAKALTPAAFHFWLLNARPGEVLVYHVGNLMLDREYPALTGTRRNPDPITRRKEHAAELGLSDPEFEMRPIASVDALARTVLEAARQGHVELSQRRIAPGVWAYRARKRGRLEVDRDLEVRRVA